MDRVESGRDEVLADRLLIDLREERLDVRVRGRGDALEDAVRIVVAGLHALEVQDRQAAEPGQLPRQPRVDHGVHRGREDGDPELDAAEHLREVDVGRFDRAGAGRERHVLEAVGRSDRVHLAVEDAARSRLGRGRLGSVDHASSIDTCASRSGSRRQSSGRTRRGGMQQAYWVATREGVPMTPTGVSTDQGGLKAPAGRARSRTPIAWWIAGEAVLVGVAGLALASGRTVDLIAAIVVVQTAFLTSGMVAWRRRPDRRLGVLLMLVAAPWALAIPRFLIPELAILGAFIVPATDVGQAYVLLAFPRDRINGRLERGGMVLLAGTFAAYVLMTTITLEPIVHAPATCAPCAPKSVPADR